MKLKTKLEIIRWVCKILRYSPEKDFKPIIIDVRKIIVIRNSQSVSYRDLHPLNESEREDLKKVIEGQVLQKIFDFMITNKIIDITWKDSLQSYFKIIEAEVRCIKIRQE